MSMNVYWFNPENDIALGLDAAAGYTPPRAAVETRRAGAFLPLLWAGPDDRILVIDPSDRFEEWRTGSIDPHASLHPWGWSRYAADIFSRHGATTSLPSPAQLSLWRQLSHRATATHVLRAMGEPDHSLPTLARTTAEALAAIESLGGHAMVKLPWSCSGRGIMPVSPEFDQDSLKSFIDGMIRRQHGITIERRLNRLRDFATLYYKEADKVTFRGLSLFHTDDSGHYAGNIVAPQCQLRQRLNLNIDHIIDKLIKALGVCLPGYNGWIGVDMMEHLTPDGRHAIAPCIEVNLRMTMGVAALLASSSAYADEFGESLLHMALPGTELPHGSLTFSTRTPPAGQPLPWPVIALSPLRLPTAH